MIDRLDNFLRALHPTRNDRERTAKWLLGILIATCVIAAMFALFFPKWWMALALVPTIVFFTTLDAVWDVWCRREDARESLR